VEVGHGWLVHAAIPSHVARLAHSVPVHVLVVLMINRSLSSSPLSVCIGDRRILRKDSSDSPVEQVWVVHKGLGIECVIVENNRTVVTETTANTSDDEIADPAISEPAADIEVLDGELANDSQAEKYTNLSASGVVSPVKVGLVSGTSDHGKISSREPALEDLDVVRSFRGPLELSFFKGVFGDTETNQFTILNVISNLGVDSSSHSVIVGVLKYGVVCKTIISNLLARPVWRASLSCTCRYSYQREYDSLFRSS